MSDVRGNSSHEHRTPDLLLARLAGPQHGVVSRAQLIEVGLDGNAIAYRHTVGRLHLLHRGVYAVGHSPPSPFAAAMAAVLACGRDAVLSHRSAAALWRMQPRWLTPIEVTAPTERRHPGIHVHVSRSADTTTHHGIPTANPTQTLIDLADVLDDRALARAVNEAYVQGLTKPTRLAALITRSPGRRTTRLRPLATATNPTRSHLEDDFLRFIKRHRLPTPEVNQNIAGHEVDFVWRERRLVAELDGYGFHTTRQAFERDRERDADLLNAGLSTIRITHTRLRHHAAKEAKRLRELLR